MKRKIIPKILYYLGRILGWFLVVLGFLGLILPILPGIPFLVLGFLILGTDMVIRDQIINLFPKRFRPGIQKRADKYYSKKKQK